MRLAQRQIRSLLADRTVGIDKMLNDPDLKKGERVMQAMLQMKKLDIKRLEQAYGQG